MSVTYVSFKKKQKTNQYYPHDKQNNCKITLCANNFHVQMSKTTGSGQS